MTTTTHPDTSTETPKLADIPTTDSGSIRKTDAMQWMEDLEEPDEEQLLQSVVPKPEDHSGSTFPTPISTIRITGTPDFLTQVAKLLKPLLVYESSATRVALNVQQVEDRETGELTDNYALYLSVAKRSTQAGVMQALTKNHTKNDQRLLDVLEGDA